MEVLGGLGEVGGLLLRAAPCLSSYLLTNRQSLLSTETKTQLEYSCLPYFTLDPQPWPWTLTACLHPGQPGFTLDTGQPGFTLESLDTEQSGLTLDSLDTFLHTSPWTLIPEPWPWQPVYTLVSLASPWTLDSLASTWTPDSLVILNYIYEHFILVTRNEEASYKNSTVLSQ